MYIKFNDIKIEKFQAIKSASVDLDSQGIVIVKGVNDYESCADSNGSGKSSVFESIVWCLFGQTSNGISDVKNRYINDGCYVSLNFAVDSENYTVIRTDSKVTLMHNGNDITCKNKTDTNKLIKEIFPFTQDVLLSTVFLSQGFNSRLGALSPSGRKERIETLTGISDKVDNFKDYVSKIKSHYADEKQNCEKNISYNSGIYSYLIGSLENNKNKLHSISNKSDGVSIDELTHKRSELKNEVDLLVSDINKYKSEYANIKYEIQTYEKDAKSIENTIAELKEKLMSLHRHICPTCRTELVDSKADELSNEYKSQMVSNKVKLGEIYTIRETLDSSEYTLSTKIQNALKSHETKACELKNLDADISSAQLSQNYDNIESEIKELESKLFKVNNEIENYKVQLSETEDKCNIANHCISLISKQFRTYLLENVLSYMNTKLTVYSNMMFSNECDNINLKSEASKLNIYLGNSLYESLSGGEKRKVDIAITLAQRDLLMDIAGVTTNILILDEVMDFMDESATNSALSTILTVADTISSMFIISHNNYAIPSDKTLEIRKNEKRYSTVRMV